MTIQIYGIRHCDTMKKAFAWLDSQGLEYRFHDYQKAGVPMAELRHWLERWDWELLINRKGTTWRRLPEHEREIVVDAESALRLMETHPSLIRRPILTDGDQGLLGFDVAAWAQAFPIRHGAG
ncbi:Spx/MgsR family RNA polymerase-binding regulatory protein [Acidithiobacillus ferrivorans]|jgi:Spx/MgsR family transcriptional regulator|uniref:Spx/MgsR family RNA polymerase-binding regulatory protein n=1 Tax=Acidithiobacillus ferrivorans TaxID=160808 RepID=A0A7T4WE63_9PROT|nr:Spx/MgsR family RNA polymerase-binding regulatory protein [Acidithiobacillus ferrivorans]QQD72800.1 Spx/MgsR family RNA polymerase-binding regulatory protein [Acidithiobacillus ferrivorans]